MLYAVIDIGSNSARLMMHDGRKTLYKRVKITRLAENMGEQKVLANSAIDRTVCAVQDFVKHAREQKVDVIYIFATASLRNSKNGQNYSRL